jgi:ribonuclease-3
VLGLVVSEMLYEAYPDAPEGDLSVRLARLVRRETCAEVAEDWDVGPHVLMGQGEARAGGRKKAAILSDICESLIGAVFLDAGFPAARALVRRFWQPRMLADAAPIQDAKTAVQEWAQARGLATPSYTEVERSGPAHLPVFVMQVALEGYAPERGEGSSKRAAEQAAARAFLDRWAHL